MSNKYSSNHKPSPSSSSLNLYQYKQPKKKTLTAGSKLTCSNNVAGAGNRNRLLLSRERKFALMQDIDKLTRKLKQQENVHKALERAFNRPLGSLPRLPPYLPPSMIELLAEVAVLEEEVVWLEQLVLNFRQGLYKEAVCTSSSRSRSRNRTITMSTLSNGELPKEGSKRWHSRSISQSEVNLESSRIDSTKLCNNKSLSKQHAFIKLSSPQQDRQGKENQSLPNSSKDKPSVTKKAVILQNPMQGSPMNPQYLRKGAAELSKMPCRVVHQALENSPSSLEGRVMETESEANKISVDVLRCLFNIFLRLNRSRGKTMDAESFSSFRTQDFSTHSLEKRFCDPYYVHSVSRKEEVGPYKMFAIVEAYSFDLNRKSSAMFLLSRLKLLLNKLASVKLEGLSHQQKLAFWMNTYNSCMMNAYLEHGTPENPEDVVMLMRKAAITVGGHTLHALTIEQFILRLPYHLAHSQQTCPKSAKGDEAKTCGFLGLELSEPLVTFALSCGSWSSPAVRVYTAARVETELEVAKREYLQAAVGISKLNKLTIPKLLDWYHLDFAKDQDAFLDWLCLQLPTKLRNQALKCLERKGKEPLLNIVEEHAEKLLNSARNMQSNNVLVPSSYCELRTAELRDSIMHIPSTPELVKGIEESLC